MGIQKAPLCVLHVWSILKGSEKLDWEEGKDGEGAGPFLKLCLYLMVGETSPTFNNCY
jgi:hypothetical protein